MGNVQHVQATEPEGESHISLLTPQEVRVLGLLSIAATNDLIADKLGISLGMVEDHISKIFRKINAPNRFQAALWAAKHLWEDREV